MARLNKEQAAAASHSRGHAIVLAGPGTGKTTTLVARHVFLTKTGTDAGAIVVVTFTNKAADELRMRLGSRAPSDAWIGTFHAICARLLKRFHREAGLRRTFKILDPQGQRQVLLDLGIRWDNEDGELTDIIGRWKDSLISPDEASARANQLGDGSTPLRLAADHYASYEEELHRRGDLDFADLVSKAVGLIRSSDKVGAFVGSRFRHVLVDEFQDVNLVQAELLSALAAQGAAIWAVADDDQALYGWRGGDVRLTVNFADRFRGAAGYKLIENYRSDPAILAAANTLIARNRMRVRKALKPTRPHVRGNLVNMRSFPNEREEAGWIARSILHDIDAGRTPKSIAILFRTASVTPFLQQELEKNRVPFALSGAANFWDMPEVRAVADLLLEIARGIPGAIAAKSRTARDLVATMKGSPPSEAALAAGRAIAAHPPPGSSGERAASWADSAEAAAAIAIRHASAESFSQFVETMRAKSMIEEEDAVAVSTIHSAKGLEWDRVFIAGCDASLMPHRRSADIEEERRLLYVGLTRSRGSVEITTARTRFGRSQTPSPFLAELAASPGGAAVWVGEAPSTIPKTTESVERTALRSSHQSSVPGGPRIFRRRGGRSLIGPEDE